MGVSRKYPYPYHGRHIGIPKGIWGYIERNSEGSLGEFIGGGSLDWNSKGIGGGVRRVITSSLVYLSTHQKQLI